MKLVNVCFVSRMKDFPSPYTVYEGAGGTGEKCCVQAAMSMCSVCCSCLLHDAGAELAGTTSFVPPSLATPALSQQPSLLPSSVLCHV